MKITSFRGKYYFLSNFYPCVIHYNGLTYKSVEAAYQAQKSLDGDVRKLYTEYDAKTSKKEGKNITIRKDWNDVRLSIMADLLQIKFSIPELKQNLLDTGDVEIIEVNFWRDVFWGVFNGVGQNHLGKLLMKTRLYCSLET